MTICLVSEADQDLLEDVEQGFEGRQQALRSQSDNLRLQTNGKHVFTIH